MGMRDVVDRRDALASIKVVFLVCYYKGGGGDSAWGARRPSALVGAWFAF